MWFIVLNFRGFYPKGGGEVHVQTQAAKVLKPIEMTDFGHVIKIYGTSYVAGVLPYKVSVTCKYQIILVKRQIHLQNWRFRTTAQTGCSRLLKFLKNPKKSKILLKILKSSKILTFHSYISYTLLKFVGKDLVA